MSIAIAWLLIGAITYIGLLIESENRRKLPLSFQLTVLGFALVTGPYFSVYCCRKIRLRVCTHETNCISRAY